jgi:hypothetical protein
MVYPPRPHNISIPAVVAGNILQNDDTSISAIDSGFDGAVVIKTENKVAMLIGPSQKTSLNTQTTKAMLTVNNKSSMQPTLRLSYQDSFYFDAAIDANGNTIFTPNCKDPAKEASLITAFERTVDIMDHDGSNLGLKLGGTLITASASEINYVDVPAGIARANRALVLDNTMNITGINSLGASDLRGTLQTAFQPNITTLNNINITGTFKIKGDLFDYDPSIYDAIKVPSLGVAYANKAVVLDVDKNIIGLNTVSANSISGILAAGPQPNITSISALTSLTNNGRTQLNDQTVIKTGAYDQLVLEYSTTTKSTLGTNATGSLTLSSSGKKVRVGVDHNFEIPSHNGTNGLILASTLVRASGAQLNYTNVDAGVGTALKALVLDATKSVSGINVLETISIFGTLQTSYQPNITRVDTLNIASHDGRSIGLALNGTLVTATADQLNALNVQRGVAVASKALVLSSTKDVAGINSLSATTVTGTLLTAEQLNIRTVNTLTIVQHNGVNNGLRLGTTLVTASAEQLNRLTVDAGVVTPNKAIIASGANSITGFNTLSASNLVGTLQTASQPNIKEVNTLNIATHDGSTIGLSFNGNVITSTADQLNRVNVDAGIATVGKALVADSNLSVQGLNTISANTIIGVLASGAQLNIRQLSSINIVNHNGNNTGLSLNGILVTSTATQLNCVDVQQGVAAASKALILGSDRSITNIQSLSAVELNGLVMTAAQPYVTRVSRLNIMSHNGVDTGLSLGGVLLVATADQLNRVAISAGTALRNKALIVDDDKSINGINNLGTTTMSGLITTNYQPNLTSVDTLNIIAHDGINNGLSFNGTVITSSAAQINRLNTTVGVAVAGKAIIADTNRSIANLNVVTATSLVGLLQTASQPHLRSVSSLQITNHDGGSDGLRLGTTLVSATATQLNYTSVIPGTATSLRAMVTNEFNSISGINSFSATKIAAAEMTLTNVIKNYNTGSVVIKSYSMTDISGRMIDIQLLPTLAFNRFQPANMTSGYSCEILGYIQPTYSETYTFLITCNDRVRMWIDGEMVLHSWAHNTSPRLSSTIFLNANQWVSVYIQYQVDAGSTPYFLFEWLSNNTPQGTPAASQTAWDNGNACNSSKHFTRNSLTIYNTATANATTAKFVVDTGGDLIIDASGNDVALGTSDNLNIPAHDGITRGLYLGGVLVKPTAYELNYLKVNLGSVGPSQAMVVDASKSITGVNAFSAKSVSCDSLSAQAFTISKLSLNGPLNNFNTGELLIRQITGANVSGRVVDVATIADINLTDYDPRGLNANFSLDIIGYVLPTNTDATYRFYAIADDRVRIWVNNTLILNAWNDLSTGLEYTSDSISLTAGNWVPIYIQYQNVSSGSSLQVRWSNSSTPKSFINSAYMAWDNTFVLPVRPITSSDRLTVYSAAPGLNSVQTGSITVDSNGAMALSAKSGNVNVATANDFNVASHNGSSAGLKLAGALVSASASELNYLSGVMPGTATPLKAFVLNAERSIAGMTSISSTDIRGLIRTAAQPYITSLGTLVSSLTSTADVVLTSTNSLRLTADATACYIQAGSATSANAAADLFIGNYASGIDTSARKLMVKANGFVGIQTSSPTRALTVNGSGSTYCLRLVNNNAVGGESAFCDIGVDSSSMLRFGSNVTIGSVGTAALTVNNAGVMKIDPSGSSLQIGNTTNSALPLEIGSGIFNISSTTGYLNSDGSVGTSVPTATTYSMRTASSIIVNGTVCITSDKRLKTEVENLVVNDCRNFIESSRPVQFVYRNDESKSKHCGLIAQEVAQSKFANLVQLAPHSGLEADFESPENAAFSVSYDEIVPIMMMVLKDTMIQNNLLRQEVCELKATVDAILKHMHM